MVVWGGLTRAEEALWELRGPYKSWGKKRSDGQRRKGNIHPSECRVPKTARRDKKAILHDQHKETEGNNRMGKNRDLRNWDSKGTCFWTALLEKALESPLDSKEIQPVHPKGNQSWVFIGRTDVEAETPILWLPEGKSLLIWKTLMLGKIEGQKRRGWQRMRWLDGITN